MNGGRAHPLSFKCAYPCKVALKVRSDSSTLPEHEHDWDAARQQVRLLALVCLVRPTRPCNADRGVGMDSDTHDTYGVNLVIRNVSVERAVRRRERG